MADEPSPVSSPEPVLSPEGGETPSPGCKPWDLDARTTSERPIGRENVAGSENATGRENATERENATPSQGSRPGLGVWRPPGSPRPPYRPPALLLGSLALHAAGALALAAAPRHWKTVAGLLFADHVALAAASLWPRSHLVGENLLRLPGNSGSRNEIALTFDDGPDPEVTPRVLDLLDTAGARATFFCIGRHVEAHPDLAAEIARRGHRIENHTHTHPNLFACYLAPALRREIEDAQRAIERATGRRPQLFRAPAGLRNPLLDWVLHRTGLHLVSWTRRGFDAVDQDPAAVARRLLTGLAPGDILLLHDGSVLREEGNPQVLEVLPRILEALATRGLRSVPVRAEGSA